MSGAPSPPPRPSSRQLSELLSEVAEELKCSICLDHYSDPVFLPCHHTFCDACVRSISTVRTSTAAATSSSTTSSNPVASSASSSASSAVQPSYVFARHSSDNDLIAADDDLSVSSRNSSPTTSSRASVGPPIDNEPISILSCPLCRAECNVPPGGRFPINFQVRNLVERIKPLGKFKKCVRCRSRAAVIFCFGCDAFMCERCDEDEPLHKDPVVARAEVAAFTSVTTPPNVPSSGSATPPELSDSPTKSLVGATATTATTASTATTVTPPTLLDSSTGELARSDSLPSFASLQKSTDSSFAALNHVRVPVIDAVAILQLRRADAQLEAGTLGAQMIPPLVTREQCADHLRRWLGSSWLPRGTGLRRLTQVLVFVPHWAWKCETHATGSIQALVADGPHIDARMRAVHFPQHGNGAAHCSLRAWRRPVLVCATSEIHGSIMERLGPWDFEKVERLSDAAPEHPTARLAVSDIVQRDAWPEAERRVEREAAEELDRELRRRAGNSHRNQAMAPGKADIVVTSKTVRRLWLPIWMCNYVIANPDTGEDEEFVCYVNAQTGRCFGERPQVTASGLLGVVGMGLSLVVAPLAAYQFAKSGPW